MNTRRDFFAFTTGAVVANTVLPLAARAGGGERYASPDAELIAVCAEFDACDRQVNTVHGTGPGCIVDDTEATTATGPLFTRVGILLDRMDALRAATPAGIQARAHSLAQHGRHGEYSFDCPTTMVGRLLAYLMRDAAALGGAGAIVSLPPPPDAELRAVCAEFDAWQQRYLATDFEVAGDDTPKGQATAAEQRRCFDAQDPLVDRMCELRAVTREGHAARAQSLALWDAELMKPDPHDTGELLRAAIVRDLLA